MSDIWQTLSTEQLAKLIESIPNLAARWRPPAQGGTHRSTRAQIAARIAEEFENHGIEVRAKVSDMICSVCNTDRWVCGPEGVVHCENHHLTDSITLVDEVAS